MDGYSQHIDMLQDVDRNRAYAAAIRAAVRRDDVVFDVGCGSGLLSLLAAATGCTRVVAFEVVSELASLALQNVRANAAERVVTVLEGHSTALHDAVRELALPASARRVVVSELLDTGLLGEGVLASMRHAAATFARDVDDGSRAPSVIIPASARVYCQAVQSDWLWSQHDFSAAANGASVC
jgi:predicted RNA methylase